MLSWHAAALPPASSVTCAPDVCVPAGTAAIGRSACCTAPLALAMPAPQVAVVQLHSLVCRSVALAGTWHMGTLGSLETGKCVAPMLQALDQLRAASGCR